jgi:hypothetical protein
VAGRRRLVAAAIAALALLVATAGVFLRSNEPRGALDLELGMDADAAAAKIGIAPPGWSPAFDERFEVSSQREVDAFGSRASVSLVRSRGGALEGIAFLFTEPPRDLARAVRAEYRLERGSEPPYETWSDGRLVRMTLEMGYAQVIVAGPEYGKAYQARLLREGFSGLFRAR